MNFSEGSNSARPSYVRAWLRDEIFAASVTVASIYLMSSLIIFACRDKSKSSPKEIKSRKKIEKFLSGGFLCLLSSIFCVIRCFCEQIELRLGTISDLACRIYQHELVEVYHLSLTCLYLLLWSRQVKMYRHRALRHLSSGPLRATSFLVLFGILGCSIASATSYLVTFTLLASPVGCIYDLSFPDGPPSSLPGILLFTISFVFQFSLLGLLIYPLIKHYRVCCRSEASKVKTHRNIKKTIVRLSVCTTVCVISDGIASYLLVFVNDGSSPVFFWANIYTVNLLCNIVAVICSFADWKQRLFPCFKPDYKAIATTSGTTSGSSAV